MTLSLSIVIPVFSETNSLRKTVDDVKRQVDPAELKEILLIVAPESSPECFSVCHDLAEDDPRVQVLIQERMPGVGLALRQGIACATGTHIVLMASDGETDPAALPHMVERVKATGCAIVAANRWAGDGGFSGYGPVKRELNRIFQWLVRLLFATPLHDLTYAFRLMDARLAKSIRWESDGHAFALEALLKPLRLGVHIEEVPTKWVKRTEGESKSTFFSYGRFLLMALKVRFSTVTRAK